MYYLILICVSINTNNLAHVTTWMRVGLCQQQLSHLYRDLPQTQFYLLRYQPLTVVKWRGVNCMCLYRRGTGGMKDAQQQQHILWEADSHYEIYTKNQIAVIPKGTRIWTGKYTCDSENMLWTVCCVTNHSVLIASIYTFFFFWVKKSEM